VLVWGKSLKRRPLPHAPIPLKSFAILSIGLVQNTGQATTASPSLWAGHPMIIRDSQRINGFSVAKKSHAVSDSFLLGKTELTIDYRDYVIVR
jgi:hypothetical protein